YQRLWRRLLWLRRRRGGSCGRCSCWRCSDSALLLPAALLSNSLWTAIHTGYDQLPIPVLTLSSMILVLVGPCYRDSQWRQRLAHTRIAGRQWHRKSEGEVHATPVSTLLVVGARRMGSAARGGASPNHPFRGKLWSWSRALRQPNALR